MVRGRGTAPRQARLIAMLLVLAAGLAGCRDAGPAPADRRLAGSVEVLATWSGVEEQRFRQVLDAFQRATGISVTYTSAGHRLPAVLSARIAADDAPDVALLAQPGLLREHAAAGRLVPLDAETTRLVGDNFARTFHDLGSFDGRLYGVWFKAASKSLVWYDVAAFERLGVVPPRDLAGLQHLVDRLARHGTPPFAVAGGDGWTLTDWFENLYLRLAGPQRYDDLAAGRLPWTDGSVTSALDVLAELLAPEQLPGGVETALTTGFEEAVQQVFVHRRAAMLVQGDFVAALLSGTTDVRLGVDADVFAFPLGPDELPGIVGGGDVAVQLRPSEAGAALLRFLATPEAAQPWASQGGFLSPNLSLDLAVYPDEPTRAIARRLLEAGDDFRFDLSDLQPAAFGATEEAGLRAELRAFLVHRDAARTAAGLAAAAASASRQAATEPP
jgi:alpha-glucoside transport system substrate-binding protein